VQDRLAFRGFVERMQQHLDAYLAWAERDFPAGCKAAEHFSTLVQNGLHAVDHLQAWEPPLCFCRADPRFANVIARPDGRIGFVDWEDSGLRDAACDVADLLLHANQEDLVAPELWKAFLDAYLPARRSVDSTFDERLQCFLALFQLRWVAVILKFGVVRAQNGTLVGWEINGRPPNWRLRRYLARALAWPRTDFAAELEAIQAISFFPGIE
jgi:Ser/Thr protein kinase RdoA (MazF antagonist)